MQAADLPTVPRLATATDPRRVPQAYARPVFVRPVRRSPIRRSGRRPGAVEASRTSRRTLRALAGDVGQGTVEYVGLLLLMASVLAAVVAASKSLGGNDAIGKQVVTQIGESIKIAGDAKK